MLGWFASDFFARSPVLIFPLVALGLFMTVFVLATVRALMANREHLDRMSRLPLEAGDE
jgi:uncharacterized membrane protein (DUF485 family)